MHSLEGSHDGRRIVLPIAVFGAANLADLTHERGVALLDTGATSSAISRRFVDSLNLTSVGKRPIMVATEQRLVDYFIFRLGLIDARENGQWPHVFAETQGFQIKQSDNFDVLLGMDVLSQCDLNVSRKGTWRLEYG